MSMFPNDEGLFFLTVDFVAVPCCPFCGHGASV
jgi:hypothetical protein